MLAASRYWIMQISSVNLSKRWVFRIRSNASISLHNLISFAKQFYTTGPQTSNACLPNVWCLNIVTFSTHQTIINSDNGSSHGRPKPLSESMLVIVNWTLVNKIRWNICRNLKIVSQENAFENDFWKMTAILSHPQVLNQLSQTFYLGSHQQ